MKASAQALIKGDPSRWGVIKEGVKIKAQEFLPGDST
jgi:pyruvate dehydrogenase (quinone)